MRRLLLLLTAATCAGCITLKAEAGGGSAHTFIETPEAPAAIGPYSQAVRVGRVLYLSGQIGLDPATGQMVEGGIEAETRQVMRNLEAVLRAAGFAWDDVVQAQVFLAELDDFNAMNEIYQSFLGPTRPARATVQVARLPRGARVEIMMTAQKD